MKRLKGKGVTEGTACLRKRQSEQRETRPAGSRTGSERKSGCQSCSWTDHALIWKLCRGTPLVEGAWPAALR